MLSYEEALKENFSSKTKTGFIIRALGKQNGSARVGRNTIQYVWDNLVSDNILHKDVKKIILIASELSRCANKKTITIENIKCAVNIFNDFK